MENKVYVLTDVQAPYESYSIYGVYTTYEKALEKAKEVYKNKYDEEPSKEDLVWSFNINLYIINK